MKDLDRLLEMSHRSCHNQPCQRASSQSREAGPFQIHCANHHRACPVIAGRAWGQRKDPGRRTESRAGTELSASSLRRPYRHQSHQPALVYPPRQRNRSYRLDDAPARDRDVRPRRSPRPAACGGHQIHCSPPDPFTGDYRRQPLPCRPAAEYPAVALALDAELVIAHASGQRSVPARDFIVGPLETALRPDELLIEIRIAARRADEGFAFEEISRRQGDFAVIGVAAAMSCADGRISDARLAIFGLGDGPALADDAARALIGHAATAELFEQAGLAAAASVTTQGDLHATADYRTHLIQTLVPRVAGRAFRHAAGASS